MLPDADGSNTHVAVLYKNFVYHYVVVKKIKNFVGNKENEKSLKAVSIHCLGLLESYGYGEDNKKGIK